MAPIKRAPSSEDVCTTAFLQAAFHEAQVTLCGSRPFGVAFMIIQTSRLASSLSFQDLFPGFTDLKYMFQPAAIIFTLAISTRPTTRILIKDCAHFLQPVEVVLWLHGRYSTPNPVMSFYFSQQKHQERHKAKERRQNKEREEDRILGEERVHAEGQDEAQTQSRDGKPPTIKIWVLLYDLSQGDKLVELTNIHASEEYHLLDRKLTHIPHLRCYWGVTPNAWRLREKFQYTHAYDKGCVSLEGHYIRLICPFEKYTPSERRI